MEGQRVWGSGDASPACLETAEPVKVGVRLQTEHVLLEVEVEEDEGSKRGTKETRWPRKALRDILPVSQL